MDNEYPTIISFYTNNWEYPEYANKMRTACSRLHLLHHIHEQEDTGNWLKNTRIKPRYIYETLQKVQRPVLWIDVDGSILGKPELLKSGYPHDFAAKKMPPTKPRTWHVGTMYFAYSENTLKFLEEWVQKTVDAKWSDELALDHMWRDEESAMRDLNVGELPSAYFEMLRTLNGAPSTGTIVCHRASKSESKMKMKSKIKARIKSENAGKN